MRMILLLLAMALAAPGCRDVESASPADEYRHFVKQFARASREEKAIDAVWEGLSEATRERFTAAAVASAKATGTEAPKDGRFYVIEQARPFPRSVAAIEERSRAGDTVVLAVTDDRQTTDEITLRREGGRWRVDLAEARAKPPNP